jgi:hypothetical protein
VVLIPRDGEEKKRKEERRPGRQDMQSSGVVGKEGAKREFRFRVGKERGVTCHMPQTGGDGESEDRSRNFMYNELNIPRKVSS